MGYYYVFSSCKFVEGFNRYCIYDLLRSKCYFINKSIGAFLQKAVESRKGVFFISKKDELIENLLAEEIIISATGFPIEKLKQINYSYDDTSIITNLIIDFSNFWGNPKITNNLKLLIERLRIKSMQIVYHNDSSIEKLLKFIKEFNHSFLYHIELIFLSDKGFSVNKLKKLENENRVQSIIILKDNINSELIKKGKMQFIRKDLFLSGAHLLKFGINQELFTEALLYNTYFNRKMHIDRFGNIGNAPELKEKFGSIGQNFNIEKLKVKISGKKFQKYWEVKKDIIHVCKDCEFRYMCVDTRVPILTKDLTWKHKSDCNYNPYLSKWKDK